MIYRTELEIYELVRAFKDRTLPKSEWTHAAYLTVAMHYCIHHAFGVAKSLMGDGLYGLNDKFGTTGSPGYHETLNAFWLTKVADFLKENDHECDVVRLANQMIAELGDPDLPLKHYSRELLLSKEAKLTAVKPDLYAPARPALKIAWQSI